MKNSKLNFFYHSFKQVKPFYWFVFLFAIICLLNYECYIFTRTIENKFTRGINHVVVQIIYAYVTGVIFYYFIELYPKSRKKISTFTITNNSTFRINQKATQLISAVCDTVLKKGETCRVSHSEFNKACDNILITQNKVILNGQSITFHDFVVDCCDKISKNIDALMNYSDFFDHNWINHLSRANNLVHQLECGLTVAGPNSKLGLSSVNIWPLYFEAKKLLELSNEYSKDYRTIHTVQNPIGTGFYQNEFIETEYKGSFHF
ncbi:MAG: hypothetical protein JNK27_11005 [Chitinophagaceae bacterium]|nr:hypothetical protein [Chitinophagaceae bacterium]